MALTRSTARRYAEAGFQLAEEEDAVEAWLAGLAIAEERLASTEAMSVLANPAIPLRSRLDVLDGVLAGDVRGAPRNLIALLVSRHRIDLLPAVVREFRRIHERREGIVRATVTSASPLDAEQVRALRERLASLSSARIDLEVEVDPALLGGLTVRLGDQLIDGSVRGRLERLRSCFLDTAS
jgi:F-type H+-transporting ATPase subunit delta